MADIFDEIEEELKQDRLNSLWAKYGKYLVGFAVAIVALVAGFQGYKSWQKNTIETAADNYHQALMSDQPASRLAEVRPELSAGYQMLAGFRQAEKLASQGNMAEAEQVYLALSTDSSIDSLYQDIALLLSVMTGAQTASTGELRQRLEPLISSANVLQGLALEQAAALDIRDNDMASARARLEQIGELTEISGNLRMRAEQLLDILGQ